MTVFFWTQLGGYSVTAALLFTASVTLWLWLRLRRARAEIHDLRKQLAWRTAVLEPIEEGLLSIDGKGRPTYVNRRFWQIFRRPRTELATMRLQAMLGEEAASELRAAMDLAIAQQKAPAPLEWQVERGDGSTMTLSCSLRPIESGGLRLGWLAAFRDVSRERLMERSRRVLAQRLEFLFRKMPLACIFWDLDLKVVEWNGMASKIFGWSGADVIGRSYHDIFGASDNDAMALALHNVGQGNGPRSSQCRHRTRADSSVDIEWFHTPLLNESGEVAGIASMGNDLTQKLLLEQDLAQAQKMEAVGALASGVAHDFNNLLTAILGNLSMLQFQIGPSHPAAQGLKDGVQAAERASELTQQLLRFSRRSSCELRPVHLGEQIREVAQLFRMGLDKDIELRCSVDPDLWTTTADDTQIAQVLMNLLVNARDATAPPGVIEMRVRNRTLDAAERQARSWAAGRCFVEIEVVDHGCGIPDHVRSRVFEPFFTTKPVGKGTGLGLATAYAIVQRHRGGLELETELDQGSTFRILLPQSLPDEDARKPAPGGRVLLVEPDDDAANIAQSALERSGYTIVRASTREAGCALLREEATSWSLAVLALQLPDGGGGRLITEARELRPELPLLVTAERVFENWSEPGAALLKKPFRGDEIEAAVRRTVGGHTEEEGYTSRPSSVS